MMYNAMKQAGIPASLYILPEGGHGWGIKESFRYRELWQSLTLDWLARIAPENNGQRFHRRDKRPTRKRHAVRCRNDTHGVTVLPLRPRPKPAI